MKLIFTIILFWISVADSIKSNVALNNSITSEISGAQSEEIERQRLIRDQLKSVAIEWEKKDLAGHSTDELVNMALTYQLPTAAVVIGKELQKRPEEVRAALRKELQKPLIPFDILYRIPFLAANVDTEFQVEIAKECLFRKEMKEADLGLRIQEEIGKGIFSLIAQSEKDETAVLDKLIDEGRLERGSEFELKWRKLLSGGSQEVENLRIQNGGQNTGLTGNRQRGEVSNKSSDVKNSHDMAKSPWLWVYTGILVIGILALLLKVWKDKAER